VRQDHWLRFQDSLDRKDLDMVLGVGKALTFVKSVCKADFSKVVRSAISEVWGGDYADETYVPPGWPEKSDKRWVRLGGELYSISKGAPLDMDGLKLHAISLEQNAAAHVAQLSLIHPTLHQVPSTLTGREKGKLFFS